MQVGRDHLPIHRTTNPVEIELWVRSVDYEKAKQICVRLRSDPPDQNQKSAVILRRLVMEEDVCRVKDAGPSRARTAQPFQTNCRPKGQQYTSPG